MNAVLRLQMRREDVRKRDAGPQKIMSWPSSSREVVIKEVSQVQKSR